MEAPSYFVARSAAEEISSEHLEVDQQARIKQGLNTCGRSATFTAQIFLY
jgi:hypothetical protein